MKPASRPRRQVALLVPSATAHGRGVLHGIARYARSLGNWSSSVHFRNNAIPAWLGKWKGDGILARVETRQMARYLARFDMPIIDVRGHFDMGVPVVDTDDAAVARVAVEHFRERGFRQLAFAGFVRVDFSERRLAHFQALAEAHRLPCHVYQAPALARGDVTVTYDQHALLFSADLRKWVRHLPKPVGVFACTDIYGQQVLTACQESGTAVPEEVAVLGVDDDEVFCELATPSLSSIATDLDKAGYVAAQCLDELMAGSDNVPARTLVEPTGVICRRSTDTLAVEDSDVAAALRFIRENAAKGIRVPDVVRAVVLSRRTLERRFQELLGRSPHDEIMRVRILSAQRLLRDTDLSLEAIARMTGFTYAEYLSVAFRRLTGQQPSQFRLAGQQGGGSG
jgi:LacI family transcriptional regulator